jgi:4-diphosphocytidyl-2-C-methyl-D-erythritol kinase
MVEAIESGDARRVLVGQSNDFEAPVFRHLPALAWVRDELQMAGAKGAHLCGSGSAVYGVAEDETDAHSIAERLRARYANTYVARTLSRVESDPLAERTS